MELCKARRKSPPSARLIVYRQQLAPARMYVNIVQRRMREAYSRALVVSARGRFRTRSSMHQTNEDTKSQGLTSRREARVLRFNVKLNCTGARHPWPLHRYLELIRVPHQVRVQELELLEY